MAEALAQENNVINNNVVVLADSGNSNHDISAVGENVTISKPPLHHEGDNDIFIDDIQDTTFAASFGETVLPSALLCNYEGDNFENQTHPKHFRHRYPRKLEEKKSSFGVQAAELMCLHVPVEVAGGSCTNPLVQSPQYAPYSLAMGHSSEVNAGYIMSPPKPRRTTKRSVSEGTVATGIGTTDAAVTMRVASSIAFKAAVSPPSLRSIARGLHPLVERFDYAKALLRSDEELENLSRRIRKEINESELFELALAAERAADAGEEKFAGRATTFGGEQQQNQHKYQPLSSSTETDQHRIGKLRRKSYPSSRAMSAQTMSTVSMTTLTFSSSSYTEGSTEVKNSLLVPTIGTTPNTPDRRMDRTSSAASPGLMISPSERSLLDTLTAFPTAPLEPGKRSMCVDFLRDVNEVIPHWKELHEHMRTHLYRESVHKGSLVFEEPTRESNLPIEEELHTFPLRSENENRVPKTHRRSRSFLESIADMAISGFGSLSDDQEEAPGSPRLTNCSKDSNDENVNENTPASASEVHVKSHSSHTSDQLPDGFQGPTFHVSQWLGHPDEVRASVEHISPTEKSHPSGSPFDLSELEATKSESTHVRNQSVCSSESTSRVSKSSSDLGDEVAQQGLACDSFTDVTGDGSGHETAIELLKSVKSVVSPGSLMDDEISISPSSPSSTTIRDTFSSESYLPKHQQGESLPSPPQTPTTSSMEGKRSDLGFSTPAHLRVIKGMQESSLASRSLFDAPQQPDIKEDRKQENLASTPAVSFTTQYEPNSIIDALHHSQNGDESRERIKPTLSERDTRLLALPTITSSKSDINLKSLSSRRFSRRKINQNQWLESPTTPTDPAARLWLQPMRQKQDGFPSKTTTSYQDNHVSDSEPETLYEQNPTFDEARQTMLNNMEPSSRSERSDDKPVLDKNSEIVELVLRTSSERPGIAETTSAPGVYLEEKKECDDLVDSGTTSFLSMSVEENEMDLTPPRRHFKNNSISVSPMSHDFRDDSEKSHHRTLVKCLSAPYSPSPADNSILDRKFRTIKSQPKELRNNDKREQSFPILKRSETWDGVISSDRIDAIGAVSSFISTTSAAVNDAASFLADMTTRECSKNRSALHSASQDPVSSMVEHNQRSCLSSNFRESTGVLCHGEANIKSAVQGVLSHLSLSPKDTSPAIVEPVIFLTDLENKEFLQNYFYCAKQVQQQQPRTRRKDDTKTIDRSRNGSTSIECSGGDIKMSVNSSTAKATAVAVSTIGGIACVVEPCHVQDTNCHMFGVDAVCSGFSSIFSHEKNNHDGSRALTCHDHPNPACTITSRTNTQTDHNHCLEKKDMFTQPKPPALVAQQQRSQSTASTFSHRDLLFASSFSQKQQQRPVDLQDQHGDTNGDSTTGGGYYHGRRSSSNGVGGCSGESSWLNLFQRMAAVSSKTIGNYWTLVKGGVGDGSNDDLLTEGSSSHRHRRRRHPFTPPCLTRRVLTRNQTTTTTTTTKAAPATTKTITTTG